MRFDLLADSKNLASNKYNYHTLLSVFCRTKSSLTNRWSAYVVNLRNPPQGSTKQFLPFNPFWLIFSLTATDQLAIVMLHIGCHGNWYMYTRCRWYDKTEQVVCIGTSPYTWVMWYHKLELVCHFPWLMNRHQMHNHFWLPMSHYDKYETANVYIMKW